MSTLFRRCQNKSEKAIKNQANWEFAKNVDPRVIGTITVLTINVIKNAFEVAVGKKTKSQLFGEFVRDMYISIFSLARLHIILVKKL